MHQLVYSFLRQGGQPCGFYPQKVEIRGNEKRMWKCGNCVEISGKWYKLDILRGKEREVDRYFDI